MTVANSKRKYIVVVAEQGTAASQDITVSEIINPKPDGKDWEYIYALGDILDLVLDLPIMGSLYFTPNRDNKDSKGIIVRKS